MSSDANGIEVVLRFDVEWMLGHEDAISIIASRSSLHLRQRLIEDSR